MHAFLVCGQNQDRVGEKVENLLQSRLNGVSQGNRLDLSPSAKKESKLPTLTIEDVRFITNWLSQKTPDRLVVIIRQAQTLTVPAQQALLKTLEEPGGENLARRDPALQGDERNFSVTIILTADSEFSLLPTTRSRCKIIRLPADPSSIHVDSTSYSSGNLHRLTEIGNKSPSEKLTILYDLLSEFSGKKFSPSQQGSIPRPDAMKFMEHIIDSLHSSLIHKSLFINHKSLTSYLSAACLSHRRLKNNLNVQLALQQFILDIPKM